MVVLCGDCSCRGIISYTSYSRTKDYVKLHIMATTTSTLSKRDEQHRHCRAHEHALHSVLSKLSAVHDAQLCHIAPVAQVCLARVIPSMHVHLCVALWLISLHPSPVFYFVPPFFFPALPDVLLRVQREVQVQTLCDFRLGTVATSDHETPPHRL